MKRFYAAAFVAALSIASGAHATIYVVDALANSSNSGAGVGLPTISLATGDLFTVTAGLDDLWSAGALPRWSNADGLVADRVATGTDESGQPAGTLIGTNFGLLTIDGLSAPYGSLVGQIGTGVGSYRLLGTNFSGAAWGAGTLKLYYWDTFTPDNAGSVAADVETGTVPEPAAWVLTIGGFGLAGAALRRRRAPALA
ncbi:MAG TPA: PEPxxWA-CTERM sorting domain-containing protein [Phenylobacterium sp.]|nr:PEPxxWA-CTERM sorting domain-containing protein [Phenylobacterium sp.]